MVTVSVFDAAKHTIGKLRYEDALLVHRYMLNGLAKRERIDLMKPRRSDSHYLLYNTTAVHLQGKWQNMTFHDFSEQRLLDLVAELEELLNDL